MEAREAASQAHALGVWGFGMGNGTLDGGAYAPFIEATSEMTSLLSSARTYASSEQAEALAAWQAGDGVAAFERLREIALFSLERYSLEGVTGADWHGAASVFLADMAALEGTFRNLVREEMIADLSRSRRDILVDLGLIVFSILSAALVFEMTRRTISRPLGRVARAMRALGRGQLDVDLPDPSRHGAEIGDLIGATHRFLTTLEERERLTRSASERTVEDERRRVRVEAAIETFRCDIRRTLDSVASQLDGVASASATLTDVTARNQQAATGTDEAAARARRDIEDAGRTVTGLVEAAGRIGDEVARAVGAVGGASRAAADSQDRMAALTRATDEVGKIVTLINDIAEQTNLLALNATIEAVRAGEAGRGFVVVASEVKSLAGQTANATDEITRQIAGIQSAVAEVASSMSEITSEMEEADRGASSIAHALNEQSDGMTRVAETMGAVRREAGSVSSHSEGMTLTAQTAREAAGSVDTASCDLRRSAGALEEAVETFLEHVAA